MAPAPMRRGLRRQFLDAFELLRDCGGRWMLAATFVLIVQSLFPPLLLFAIKRIVDGLTRLGGHDWRQLIPALLLALTIAVAEAVVRAVAAFVAEQQALRTADAIEERLAAQAATLDLAQLEDPANHDLIYRAAVDGPQRALLLSQSLNQVLRAALTLAGLSVLMVSIHVGGVALALLAIVPLLGLRAWHGRSAHRRLLRVVPDARRAAYFWDLLTRLDHAKEVRTLGARDYFVTQLTRLRTRVRHEKRAVGKARAVVEALTQSAVELVLFGALALLAWRVAQGDVGIGTLVVGFWGLQFARSLASELLSGLAGMHEHVLHLSGALEFLALAPQMAPAAPAHAMPTAPTHGIELHEVSLRYPGAERLALDRVSLRIAPGQNVALVGENGSGKTSLIKLLCRLYDPTTGVLTFEGRPYDAYPLAQLQGRFSVLFQDFARFEMSTADNVTCGDLGGDAGREDAETRLTRALALAGVVTHDADALLGRRFAGGGDLSIGQWQRIALARLAYRRASILLLDEPTSALDAHAEQQFLDRLLEHAAGRTMVIVSHRLSAVRHADRIVVLDEGRIVEDGAHAELLARGGHYARLFERQARPYR